MQAVLLWLAKLLLTRAADAAMRKALPEVFDRIDGELPYWYGQRIGPKQVEGLIGSAVADAVGRKVKPADLELIRLLYDPVLAARNNLTLRLK